MEAVRCSETFKQATFTTRCRNLKDDSRLNKIAASVSKIASHQVFRLNLHMYFYVCPAHLIHFDLIIVVSLREAYNVLRLLLCNFLPSHIISSPASVEFSLTKSKTMYFSNTVRSVTTAKPCTYNVEIHIASRGSIWAGTLYVRGHQKNLFLSLCRLKETIIVSPLLFVKHKRKWNKET
jgi:hypothetical protein